MSSQMTTHTLFIMNKDRQAWNYKPDGGPFCQCNVITQKADKDPGKENKLTGFFIGIILLKVYKEIR